MKPCAVCLDSKGFTVRPCPGCGHQKRLSPERALLYRLPFDHLVQPGDLDRWTKKRAKFAEKAVESMNWRGRRWAKFYEEGY